jgi:hypothetical protein
MAVQLKTEIVTVTQEVAEEFLKHRKAYQPGVKGTNRRITEAEKRKWADDMAATPCRWLLTHEGLAFNSEGEFVDGQHRMEAFLIACRRKPGLAIDFMVTYGVAPEAFKVMNSGRKRKLSDVLSTEGYVNVNLLQTVAKMHFCYHTVPYETIHSWGGSVPNWNGAIILDWVDSHPTILSGVERVIGTAGLNKIGNSSALAAGYALATEIRPDVDTNAFIQAIRDGRGTGWDKGKPEYELRERLIARKKGHVSNVERIEQLGLFVKAFNAYAAGRTDLKALAFTSGGSFPRIASAIPESLDATL